MYLMDNIVISHYNETRYVVFAQLEYLHYCDPILPIQSRTDVIHLPLQSWTDVVGSQIWSTASNFVKRIYIKTDTFANYWLYDISVDIYTRNP